MPEAETPADPLLPDYGGACITNVVPGLFAALAGDAAPDWLPGPVTGARQVVLLVVDGLGWGQLTARARLAPTLAAAAGAGRPITSVAPTTTATALTSITTGRPPADHGLLGYRLAAGDEILNVLRWTLGSRTGGDARGRMPAGDVQRLPPFPGAPAPVPVVSRVDFAGTGFTAAHLGSAPLHGYRVLSSLPIEAGALLDAGAPFVYAYYDGIDKVAHGHGLGAHYDAELRDVDRMVAELAGRLPDGAALVVTADHGQIDVGPWVELLGRDVMAMVHGFSGEGRFRWVHARAGATDDLVDALVERYGATTWVRRRDELVADGWFGGPLAPGLDERLGDVALVPHAPLAFADPADTGENRLASRHGSLTADELLVPLVALGGG